MDSRERDRELVQRILTDYAQIPYAHGAITCETVFDDAADRYLLMLVGWDGLRRVHGCLIHVDFVGEEIWVQRDGTERGVARDLTEAGVPRDRIVLAFRPAEVGERTTAVVG
jgi:XisI protein